MGQALYRKYRSRSLDEVIGQDHIKDTLIKALASNKLSHAYLFTGPRGVGKTSVARVLAYEANNLTYDPEVNHLDIIEIDAASNRRIDEIRELRDKVNITPALGQYKVYIIDEVHMLTKEAFNALLKTLEEPPAHVIFILATTEAHKVPETILSRTQRFTFKPISENDIASHLSNIAKKEKITISDDAVGLLAKHSDGSFRDSLSLLDQLSAYSSKISKEQVQEALGLPPSEQIERLLESLTLGRKKEILETLEDLKIRGVSAVSTTKALADGLRDRLISGYQGKWLPDLLKELLEIPTSNNPDTSLEISLLASAPENTLKTEQSREEVVVLSKPPETPKPARSEAQIPDRPFKKKAVFSIDKWPEVLERIKTDDPSLYSVYRLAKPELKGDTLLLHFEFSLHEKKADQTKNKGLLSRTLQDMYEKGFIVRCRVNKAASSKVTLPHNDAVKRDPDIGAISNIFGSAQILES